MIGHRPLALVTAAGALAFAAPAVAQTAEPYEYAEPAAEGEVIYQSAPVIQPLPGPPPVAAPVAAPPMHGHHAAAVAPAPHAHVPSPVAHHSYAPHPHAMDYRPMPPFDRDAWLADCRERIRGVDRSKRGGIIGGLLGAAAGGVIGNRAWDSERLAGTLIGVGVGGLAGAAIGAVIGAAGDRERDDECAWHLDRHMAGGHPGYGYGYRGYAYGYGYGYGWPTVAYVPVLVAVPQRAVVRETVTEEWVEAAAPVRSHTETKIIREHAPAPAPDKRVKYRKGR